MTEHLAEIEQTAQKMITQAVTQMAKAEGVTEELSDRSAALDGSDEQSRHSAEEQVLNDLIYS